MARKTKAELEAERQEALALHEAHEFAQYPTLLLDTLERATRLGFELTVRNAKFVVEDRNSRANWTLNPTHTKDSQADLEALMWDVESVEAARAEEERRYAMKQAALSKLSKEERELLGL